MIVCDLKTLGQQVSVHRDVCTSATLALYGVLNLLKAFGGYLPPSMETALAAIEDSVPDLVEAIVTNTPERGS